MAIGKSNVDINLNKLSIKFGDLIIVNKGKIYNQYNETEAANYMKGPAMILVSILEMEKKTLPYILWILRKNI